MESVITDRRQPKRGKESAMMGGSEQPRAEVAGEPSFTPVPETKQNYYSHFLR